jgi:hypothetical protein
MLITEFSMNLFRWILLDSPPKAMIRLADVEMNKNYAIVITTNSGLWRYLIGDRTLYPYIFRIRVTGRTKHHINVFGEEWSRIQITQLKRVA